MVLGGGQFLMSEVCQKERISEKAFKNGFLSAKFTPQLDQTSEAPWRVQGSRMPRLADRRVSRASSSSLLSLQVLEGP